MKTVRNKLRNDKGAVKMDKNYDDEEIINALVRVLGSNNNALDFVLALEPYTLCPIHLTFLIFNLRMEIEAYIKDRYEDISKEDFTKMYKHIETYYDFEGKIIIPRKDGLEQRYRIAKRSLVYDLLESTNNYFTYSISRLRTIWFAAKDVTRILEADENINFATVMPKDLLFEETELDRIEQVVLKTLILQDRGLKQYTTIQEIAESVVANGSKGVLNTDTNDKGEVLDIVKRNIDSLLYKGYLYLAPRKLNYE